MNGSERLTGVFSSKLVAVLFIAFICASVFPTTAADSDSGTETILSGHYMALPIDTSAVIQISYSIQVVSGPNIDVILTDGSGYSQYTSNSLSFQYLPQGSRLNTRSASANVEVDTGRWYLIIDNTNAGSAVPSGQSVIVDYGVSTSLAGISTGDGSYISIGAVIAIVATLVIIVIVIVVAYLVSKKRRTKSIQPIQYPTICPGCGRPAGPGAAFCEGCGRRLK